MIPENLPVKAKIREYLIPLAIFFIITASTFLFYLSDHKSYGPTWDELIFHRETGKRYYQFLKSGDLGPIMKYGNSSWFPPVAPTFGYFFEQNELVKKYLPDDNDRFHLAGIVFGSLTIGVVYIISYQLTENYSLSILAAIILAFYPQFVTQAHNNVRDMGVTFFYSLTVMVMLVAVKYKRFFSGIMVTGFLIGIATATKQNGALLLILATIFFLRFGQNIGEVKLMAGLILLFVIFIWTFIAFWPFLWVNTIYHLVKTWLFLSDPKIIAGNTVFFDKVYASMKNIPVYYPYVMLFLFTAPILALTAGAGFIVSLIYFIKGNEKGLIFLWLFLPLSRFFMQTSSISYDQIRHFFEVVPAIPILAVLFIYFLKERFKKIEKIQVLLPIWLLIITGYNIFLTFRYRPYGTAYFNMFAGKPSYVNHAFDVEYYGNVYREASKILRSRYGKNVRFYTAGLGAHILQQNGLTNPLTDNTEDDFDYVIFMNKQTWLRSNPYALWLVETQKPVYTIEREGKILFYQFLPYKEEYFKLSQRS
ncbi:hypothetical protein A2W14_03605 [Candidatus Gottesmanbacteria bacterium RBG_16_37_8]|uniref:Glycosyltransferase RgtA/B/C/D-like domain-containing protein n=1 Tax=Candidatus Gottesmanbacteria bacterium RBG_16_37_8 TaxID=1798371 RepID=A0A1F5YSG2_9BACT|nr:MAG: hypothetical protein A2W14_03605 [Candidatus Gottesmanbacteria bacterium RBG_16_37_8]